MQSDQKPEDSKLTFVGILKSDSVSSFKPVSGKAPLYGKRILPQSQSPVPLKLAVCGLSLALSSTVSVPVAFPVAVGENVTLIVQLFLVSSVVPHVEVETANGAAVENEMPVNIVGRLFFKVKVCAALVVPTVVFGKV